MHADYSHAENVYSKLNIPPCPSGSQKTFVPDAIKPIWISCRDKKLQYQGHLIQLSMQGEVLRISGIKNSLRHGKELRFGASGFLEERSYLDGHLTQNSYIYKSESVLARVMPKMLNPSDWQAIDDVSSPSILGIWLKQQPYSTVQFERGRITRIRFDKSDYHFEITPEGRMMAKDHPEMKGLFLWTQCRCGI